jgi:two-component system sensor histidine kinase TctE
MTLHAQPESLRRHLLWRLGALVAVIVLIGAAVTFMLARYFASSVFDQWLYDSASTLASQINAATDRGQLDLPATAVEMIEFDAVDRVYYDVTTADGSRLFGNARLAAPPGLPADGSPYFYDTGVLGKSVRVVAMRVMAPRDPLSNPLMVQFAETTNKRDALIAKILLSTVGPQVILLLLAALAIWHSVASGLRSVDAIAGRLALYRPDRADPLPSPDDAPAEVRPLLAALHQVVNKLADAQAGQQRFITNASHQLRTPLAALQVQAERALREPDPIKHSEALQSVLKSLKRLRHLSHQLLMLARAEPVGSEALSLRPLDLAALAREVLGNWTDAAIDAAVDLGYEGPSGGVRVRGEPHLLQELIGNLVDNAMRYSGRGARVTVIVADGGSGARLEVEDDGPGIPENERLRVLERFYRRPGAEGEGSGLGLSIAREIVNRHDAEMHIESGTNGKGTRVVVDFPVLA